MAMKLFNDTRVHTSTVGDNGLITIEQETIIEMGTSVYTDRLAFIRNTCPAIYNHVVQNMNRLIHQTKEKQN
jgi:hypothetical protein